MKKLFAVVAVAALALTSAAPVVQAAQPTASQIHKPGHSNVHKVATKKKTTSKSKATKKKVSSKARPAVGTPKKA
jgi:hypothetical protein